VRRSAARDPFEALGNPQRRQIVQLLARRPRSVREISDRLPISRPAVSRHLKVLSEAGLVSAEGSGARNVYRLDGQGAEAAAAYLKRLWGDATTRFRLFAENTEHGQRGD
jgi:DNA-binding transcriptional ArsR family regulator